MPEGPVHIQRVYTVKEGSRSRALEPKAASRSILLRRGFLIGGLVLFAILVWRIGPDSIGGLLLRVGWALPLVLLPHALVTALEATGWWFAFSQNVFPIKYLKSYSSVSRPTIQHVTPSHLASGELVKIHLLRLTGVEVMSAQHPL
jgi:hypothetical protein